MTLEVNCFVFGAGVEAFLIHVALFTQSYLLGSTLMMLSLSKRARFQLFYRDANMFDRLFDAVLVPLPWAALVPMILHKNSIEVLMWYMSAVHSDHMACPVTLCFQDHGLSAS